MEKLKLGGGGITKSYLGLDQQLRKLMADKNHLQTKMKVAADGTGEVVDRSRMSTYDRNKGY